MAKAAKPAVKAKATGLKLRKEFKTAAFAKGLAVRRAVLGGEYVDASIERADDFTAEFQKMVTEFAWGEVWTRPGLARKQRSILNLGMLTALNRPNELRIHLRGALTNGVTRDEIKEILIQAAIYCGVPAALDAFKIASEVFKTIDAEQVA